MQTTFVLLIVTLVALSQAGPAPREHDIEDDSKPRPLIEFTRGGFKVNFGGFHAQAGLGALLTGRSEDGGLHASAGIPSGAHASAEIGGSLSDGPSGGLHARAGLGNGGPEAAAGLGGSLGGQKPGGEIYAESSRGNFPELPKIQKNKGKNIQVISPPKKVESSATADAASSDEADHLKSNKIFIAGTPYHVFWNSQYDVSYVKKGNGGRVKEDLKTQHPARWYFEKRLRERIGNKTTSDNVIIATPTAAEAHQEQSESSNLLDNSVSGYKYKYKNGSLFDDIFNIPISALKAVNQLLKNHVGRV
ncbi:hypothetical protein QAD02_015121 [Eretmocerus hayati]|uniref:Uncharacterized protein n=1 Tax=Eretmocerus hayati TaxID=131215 RepID=A0ACC2P7S9_9HYME|nr:hypothetical protein QAD02_015121 [Eretmocerus hayati]